MLKWVGLYPLAIFGKIKFENMKILISILFFFFYLCSFVNAQDTLSAKGLRDLLEGNQSAINSNKKSIEVNPSSDYLSNVVYKAFSNSIVLIESSFILTKGEEKFKKKNQEYYGAKQGIGFIIDGKLYAQYDLFNPWTNDKSLEKLEKDLIPKLYKFEYCALTDTARNFRLLDPLSYSPINPKNSIGVASGIMAIGNNLTSIQNPQEGFMVLFYCEKNEDIRKAKVQILLKQLSLKWQQYVAGFDFPLKDKLVLGGVFISFIPSNGVLTFGASGIFFNDNGISKIASIGSKNSGAESSATEVSESNELEKIEDKGKSSKGNSRSRRKETSKKVETKATKSDKDEKPKTSKSRSGRRTQN